MAGKIKKYFSSNQSIPLILCMALISLGVVLFRMKSVENTYKSNKLQKEMKSLTLKNKELKAKRAKKLSVRNLKKLAKKYNFKNPGASQVIVIPD